MKINRSEDEIVKKSSFPLAPGKAILSYYVRLIWLLLSTFVILHPFGWAIRLCVAKVLPRWQGHHSKAGSKNQANSFGSCSFLLPHHSSAAVNAHPLAVSYMDNDHVVHADAVLLTHRPRQSISLLFDYRQRHGCLRHPSGPPAPTPADLPRNQTPRCLHSCIG